MVHDKLMMLGGKLVVETVDAILAGTVKTIPQEELPTGGEALRPAPKIFKDTCRIDWNRSLKAVYDFVRGLSPYPAAWTELEQPDGKRLVLKVYEAAKVPATHSLPAGSVRTDGKTYFQVAVEGGYLDLRTLQLAGKKRMGVADFLRGYKLTDEHRMD